jgi:hypothetical protein
MSSGKAKTTVRDWGWRMAIAEFLECMWARVGAVTRNLAGTGKQQLGTRRKGDSIGWAHSPAFTKTT